MIRLPFRLVDLPQEGHIQTRVRSSMHPPKRMELTMHNEHNDPEIDPVAPPTPDDAPAASTTRKSFLKGAAAAGAGATALGALAPAAALANGRRDRRHHGEGHRGPHHGHGGGTYGEGPPPPSEIGRAHV